MKKHFRILTHISGGLLSEPQVDFDDFNATILDTRDTSVSSSRLDYEVFLDTQETQSLISELEFNNSTIVGLDSDGISVGFGMDQAQNGFILRTTRDKFNNYKKKN